MSKRSLLSGRPEYLGIQFIIYIVLKPLCFYYVYAPFCNQFNNKLRTINMNDEKG